MMAKEAQSNARTFTQDARRAQIVQATIETLAELGYTKATFTAICRRARLSSTGMISYYFSGKPELLREVAQTILAKAETEMRARIANETTHRGKLSAYIASHLDFFTRYPVQTKALAEVVAMVRERQIADLDDIERTASSVECLVSLLDQGCRAGEFRPFDSHTMALAIRGAIDNVVRHHLRNVDGSLDRRARELADAFDRCTQLV